MAALAAAFLCIWVRKFCITSKVTKYCRQTVHTGVTSEGKHYTRKQLIRSSYVEHYAKFSGASSDVWRSLGQVGGCCTVHG